MLTPRKEKHRKWQKGRGRNKDLKATRINSLDFGEYGLKATTSSWVSSRQIEAARRAVTRYVKRGGKLWIRIFPDKPVTSKGSQATMGSGKGAPDHYVAVVRPGTVIFEIAGVSREVAQESMRLAAHKLPIKAKFISKK
ncbi:MAG TPA: 50S ribosomal protein L16 [Patescibacteria group bacterium]|nr:50S ribosomal protein L16 [Patescibacteria group bacterium]